MVRHINSSHSLHTTVRQFFTIAFHSFHLALNFEFCRFIQDFLCFYGGFSVSFFATCIWFPISLGFFYFCRAVSLFSTRSTDFSIYLQMFCGFCGWPRSSKVFAFRKFHMIVSVPSSHRFSIFEAKMEKLSLLFTTHKCSTAAVSQFSHCFLCTAIVRFLCPSVACYRFSYAATFLHLLCSVRLKTRF